MHFSKEVTSYLEGQKFSNGLKIQISEKEHNIIYRLELLEKLSTGKSIVHIGFADHLPLIESKINRNIWLHNRLIAVANRCIGIDIDAEVVKYLKNEFKIENIFCLDVINEELPEIVKTGEYDYIILGEVLEHIDNPVEFLSSIRKKFIGFAKSIIITVPNAWDLSNLKLIKKGIEFINTDHRFWFTPFTLAKVGSRSGLKVREFFYVQNFRVNGVLNKWVLKKVPSARETVVMIFDL